MYGRLLTVTALAEHLGVPRGNLSNILNGKLGISAAVTLKPAQAFSKQDAELWLALQAQYVLAQERKKKHPNIKKIKPLALAA